MGTHDNINTDTSKQTHDKPSGKNGKQVINFGSLSHEQSLAGIHVDYTPAEQPTKKQPKKSKRPLTDARAHLAASAFNGRIKFNQLSGRPELWPGAPINVEEKRDWDDVLTTRLRYFFERTFKGAQPSAADVNNLVQEFAAANAYDPLIDWVHGLQWDGTPRLDTWLVDYLGATQDLSYLRAVGRSVMLSAVGRALEPGCKVDTMMVLSSGQGVSKSDACEALAPWPQLFSDAPLLTRFGDKDEEIRLSRVLIHEIADLSGFKKADVDTLKSFITRRPTLMRLPYGRYHVEIKRRAIFIGTTNPTDYLSDSTGNRRFLPVTATHSAISELRQDKVQLWAEAYEAYKGGETWVIEQKGIDDTLESEREKVLEKDPWTSAIETGLRREMAITVNKAGAFTTTSDILEKVLGIPISDRDTKDQKRVTAILRFLGWIQGNRSRANGDRVYPWYPPDDWNE